MGKDLALTQSDAALRWAHGRNCHAGFHPMNTLTPELLQRMDAYWRAANYLSVGQIYLREEIRCWNARSRWPM